MAPVTYEVVRSQEVPVVQLYSQHGVLQWHLVGLYTPYSTGLDTLQYFTFYKTVHPSVYMTVHSSLYRTRHSTLYTLKDFTLYTLHSTLYTLHSTGLDTLHSTL